MSIIKNDFDVGTPSIHPPTSIIPRNEMILESSKKLPVNFTGKVVYKSSKRIEYYKNGKLHREDGPAIELPNGHKSWFHEGNIHREDGPAVEYVGGTKEWFRYGKLHRLDGPAIEKSGEKQWWIFNQLHREDGPAIEKSGEKQWWIFNQLHREDGPAIEKLNGTCEYYLYNKKIETADKAYFVDGKFRNYLKYDTIAAQIISWYGITNWFIGLELCWDYDQEEFFFKINYAGFCPFVNTLHMTFYGIKAICQEVT